MQQRKVCEGPPQAGPQSGYGGNWNWNMPQNGPTAQGGPPGPTQGGPSGPQGDMYSRGAAPGPTAPAGPGPAAPGAATAAKTGGSDYGGYGAYSYGQDSGSYGAGRSYGGDVSNQAGAGYSAHPPVPAKDSYIVPDRGLQIHNGTLDPDDLAPLKHATITDQEYNKMQGSSVLPSSRQKKLVNVTPSDAGQGDGAGAATYTAGPGPQRGGNYSQPTATPSFHPYRRM
uniref:Uncharacterized protein n=1 Tax=Timema cristinae TaxID=61476 RepID=A0A7R9H5X0_TIMCR|nr:unnamed protein product [Timema cristinae]